MNKKYRNTIIAGNWKMNVLPSEVRAFGEALKPHLIPQRRCEVVICPSFVALPAAARALRGMRIALGAQNVSEHEGGAYTGEVSCAQLSDLDVKFVIVGHSERRAHYGETDAAVKAKVRAVLDAGLRPIVCVGETLEQRDAGLTEDVVRLQLKTALTGVPGDKIRRVVVAYEPVWAIGTGKTASAEDAGAVCAQIRACIRGLYNARIARAISILYGGSVNGQNAAELFAVPDIDGGLIGGASLSAESFAAIIQAAAEK